MANRSDDFNRADSSSSLGSPSDGGSAWVASVGTWGISSNRGYESSGAVQQNLAYLEASSAVVDVEVTIPVVGSDLGLIVRFADSSNYILFAWTSGTGFRLFKVVGGSFTQLGTTDGGMLANGDVMKITVSSGNAFNCYKNGAELTNLAATDSAGSGNTKHGLRAYSDTTSRFDTFSITDNGAAAFDAALVSRAQASIPPRRNRVSIAY